MTNDLAGFTVFMRQRQAVALAYVNGDAEPLREISAQHDPVSFFGPKGDVIKGAKKVYSTQKMDAGKFHAGGKSTLTILQLAAAGGVAYWTGIQKARVRMGNNKKSISMSLRVTELFRYEQNSWKLIHRHADMLQPASRKKKR